MWRTFPDPQAHVTAHGTSGVGPSEGGTELRQERVEYVMLTRVADEAETVRLHRITSVVLVERAGGG